MYIRAQIDRATQSRWFLHVLGLVLVLLSSATLLYLLKDGVPSRAQWATMLGVLFFIPVLLRWQYGWITLFLVIPWIAWLRRIQIALDPNAPITEAYDALLILPEMTVIAALSGYMLTRQLRKKDVQLPGERTLEVSIGLLAGMCVIQVFNPMMQSIGAGINGIRIFTVFFALFWITRLVARSAPLLSAWVSSTAVCGAISGFYGAYQYLVGFPEYDLKWANAGGAASQVVGETMRAFSTFSFTSTFSHYMVIAVFFCWGAWKIKFVNRFVGILAPVLALVILTGLAVTFVRSAFLGVIAASAFGLVVAGPAKGRLKRMLVVLCLSVAVIVAVPSSTGDSTPMEQQSTGTLVADRVLSMRDPASAGSMVLRWELWKKTVQMSFTHYPIGVGLAANAAARFGGDPAIAAHAYSESQYVGMLAEMGWPGFLLFSWVTAYALYFSICVYDQLEDPDRKRLALLGIMLQVAILTTGMTGGTVLYTCPGNAYYWTAIGLVAALPRWEAAEKEKAARMAAIFNGTAT